MRILVVDDVGYVRHYFDRLLTQNRHTVWTAASGFDALEILQQQSSIEVVITDLLMPGMDGLEFFKAAQKIEKYGEKGTLPFPVFYLITALRPSSVTTHRESNQLQQALQLGFAEVLLKPIDNEHLLRQLANLERSLRSEPGANAPACTDPAELLNAIDQNIERVLRSHNLDALAELTELLSASLARIPEFIGEHDAQPIKPSPNLEPTKQQPDRQDEPDLSTVNGLVAQNGLSMEKQT
jgi:CheY-like chemotaxis protein